MRLPDNILERIGRPGSPVQLALFRILLGLYVFYLSQSRLFDFVEQVYQTGRGYKGMLLPLAVNRFAFGQLTELSTLVGVAAVLFALGLFYRVTAWVLAISFFMLYSGVYFAQGTHAQWPYLWFILFVMAFAPAADAYSADAFVFRKTTRIATGLKAYRWPLEMVVFWLALLYTWAGLAKLLPLWKGVFWLGGGTVRHIITDRFLYSPAYFIFGKPLFNYAEDHGWLFALMAITTVAIELFALVLLFTSRCNLGFAILIAGLHGILYLIGVGDFFLISMLACFSLVSPAFFKPLDEKVVGSW